MKLDPGARDTGKLLQQLENDITAVYRQAVQEIMAKAQDYFRRFDRKDETWRGWVQDGRKTEADYKKWRTGQLIVGERWTRIQSELAIEMHNANAVARRLVDETTPFVFAANCNYAVYQVETLSKVNVSFTLYDHTTVNRIIRGKPDLLPKPGRQMKQTFLEFDNYKRGVKGNLSPEKQKAFDRLIASDKDVRWQTGKIQSIVTQSILQGESIPNMTKRLANQLGEINHKATIRYARTSVTAAQNAGRQEGYEQAAEEGVNLKKMWIATLDERTRHSHRLLDGQTVDVDEDFIIPDTGEAIRYPADPSADPAEIWNCRCTTRGIIPGLSRRAVERRSLAATDSGDYEEWKKSHGRSRSIESPEKVAEAIRWKYINEYKGRGKE